jgi:hypothetical protein
MLAQGQKNAHIGPGGPRGRTTCAPAPTRTEGGLPTLVPLLSAERAQKPSYSVGGPTLWLSWRTSCPATMKITSSAMFVA